MRGHLLVLIAALLLGRSLTCGRSWRTLCTSASSVPALKTYTSSEASYGVHPPTTRCSGGE